MVFYGRGIRRSGTGGLLGLGKTGHLSPFLHTQASLAKVALSRLEAWLTSGLWALPMCIPKLAIVCFVPLHLATEIHSRLNLILILVFSFGPALAHVSDRMLRPKTCSTSTRLNACFCCKYTILDTDFWASLVSTLLWLGSVPPILLWFGSTFARGARDLAFDGEARSSTVSRLLRLFAWPSRFACPSTTARQNRPQGRSRHDAGISRCACPKRKHLLPQPCILHEGL